jgi:hypothetical protein
MPLTISNHLPSHPYIAMDPVMPKKLKYENLCKNFNLFNEIDALSPHFKKVERKISI